MVYENLSRCFIPKDPSLGFVEFSQVVVAIARGHYSAFVFGWAIWDGL
jgi:hypothetical protein